MAATNREQMVAQTEGFTGGMRPAGSLSGVTSSGETVPADWGDKDADALPDDLDPADEEPDIADSDDVDDEDER